MEFSGTYIHVNYVVRRFWLTVLATWDDSHQPASLCRLSWLFESSKASYNLRFCACKFHCNYTWGIRTVHCFYQTSRMRRLVSVLGCSHIIIDYNQEENITLSNLYDGYMVVTPPLGIYYQVGDGNIFIWVTKSFTANPVSPDTFFEPPR